MATFYLTSLLLVLLVNISSCQDLAAEVDYDYEQPKKPSQSGQANTNRVVPVFVNVHQHPKTGFNCADKVAGQYYADLQTKCAVYYVCIPNPQGTLTPQSFACPNGTIFNQATRVCSTHDQVWCNLAERYYENVHGNIDSKGQEEVYDREPSNTWAPGRPQTRGSQNRPRTSQGQPQGQVQPKPQPPPQSSIQSQSRRQPQAAFNLQPSSTTTTTTTTTQRPNQNRPAPGSQPSLPEYEYEYIDIGNEANGTIPVTNPASVGQPPIRTRRAAPRHKGRYQTYPFDFLSKPHVLTNFTCEDKIPGIAYADMETDCKVFHVCIPVAKGKLRDYQLHCDDGKKYNQETAICENTEKVNCKKSEKYYVYNKWFRSGMVKKESWRLLKKMHGKKSKL